MIIDYIIIAVALVILGALSYGCSYLKLKNLVVKNNLKKFAMVCVVWSIIWIILGFFV
jgi:hypothetical protein